MEDNYKIDAKVICIHCTKLTWVSYVKRDFDAWCEGKYLQYAMPYLAESEKELLISGTCSSCFDAMFKEDEDGDLKC